LSSCFCHPCALFAPTSRSRNVVSTPPKRTESFQPYSAFFSLERPPYTTPTFSMLRERATIRYNFLSAAYPFRPPGLIGVFGGFLFQCALSHNWDGTFGTGSEKRFFLPLSRLVKFEESWVGTSFRKHLFYLTKIFSSFSQRFLITI